MQDRERLGGQGTDQNAGNNGRQDPQKRRPAERPRWYSRLKAVVLLSESHSSWHIESQPHPIVCQEIPEKGVAFNPTRLASSGRRPEDVRSSVVFQRVSAISIVTCNPHLARAIAKELETAAPVQRAKSTRAPARPGIYHRRSGASAPAGLTQRQVAFVLGLSSRTSMSPRSHRWWSPAHPARR